MCWPGGVVRKWGFTDNSAFPVFPSRNVDQTLLSFGRNSLALHGMSWYGEIAWPAGLLRAVSATRNVQDLGHTRGVCALMLPAGVSVWI